MNIESKIVTPPDPHKVSITLFLAGSIDNGNAPLWHAQVVQDIESYLVNRPVNMSLDLKYLNPRRADWDKSASTDDLTDQIVWELDGIKKSDIVLFYFSPESKAPVTMLEFGLCLGMKKHIIAYCPTEFYRETNVRVTNDWLTSNSRAVHADYSEFIRCVGESLITLGCVLLYE